MSVASKCEVWNCSNDDYHSRTDFISHSSKEVFRESRETYRALFVDKTMERPEPTEAMALGTAIHAAILEPDWFAANYVVRPKYDRRTTAGKADSAAWDAENGGKTCIDLESMQTVNAVREAAMSNRIVRTIVEETPPEMREHSIAWNDPETGLDCKSRRDLAHDKMTCDLKSFAVPMSAAAVAKRVAGFGYARQGAFYRVGEQQFSGELKPFVFIFLGTKPPYSVGLFDIHEDDLNYADQQNNETLAAMARCRDNPALYTPEYATTIYNLVLPKWTRYADEYGI